MKYQSFCMRVLCLLLILAAVIGYNSMQKKDTQEQETQEITQLKKRVDTLEEQQKEMLAALEEAAKNQETASSLSAASSFVALSFASVFACAFAVS